MIHKKESKVKISKTLQRHRTKDQNIVDSLPKQTLIKLYLEENRSLGDIAMIYHCSRTYIMKLARKYRINLKTKSEARVLALKSGKLPFQYWPVDENFFSEWSEDMAYVLGFVFADGCIAKDSLGNMTLVISTNDQDLLTEIKKVLKSECPLRSYKNQPKLYHLRIGRRQVIDDLLQLGVTPKKSFTMKFPEIPKEYVSHFIRGYFDGDGTIYYERRNNKPIVKFVCGSKDFLKSTYFYLKQALPSIGGKIYAHKGERAFYLVYTRKKDLIKLYDFLYFSKGELYLRRKFDKYRNIK